MIAVGIDVGSLTAQAVVVQNNNIKAYSIVDTGANSQRAALKAFETALDQAGLTKDDLYYVVATGYGRVRVPFADLQVTEITCHARGAFYYYPEARTIIDIGGQDSKVISIDDLGMVTDFVMNDKCAAGTGRFLEVMAKALEVEVDTISDLADTSTKAATITSLCTVFAESEVVSLIGQGTPPEDIAAGLLNSVAERTVALAKRVGLQPLVVMTGGVAKNRGVVQSLAAGLGCRVNVPPEPQIVGALGAALIAASNLTPTRK